MITNSLKETDYLKAWAFFWLLSTIGGFIAGALGGGILGGILGVAGVDLKTIGFLCSIFGFLLGIPVTYIFFRLSIAKLIVPKVRTQNQPVPPLPVA